MESIQSLHMGPRRVVTEAESLLGLNVPLSLKPGGLVFLLFPHTFCEALVRFPSHSFVIQKKFYYLYIITLFSEYFLQLLAVVTEMWKMLKGRTSLSTSSTSGSFLPAMMSCILGSELCTETFRKLSPPKCLLPDYTMLTQCLCGHQSP